MSEFDSFIEKIENRSCKVCVVGLGYVGLPIALEFLKKGFSVTGLDNDQHRIKNLEKKKSYINDISDEKIQYAMENGNFFVTGNLEVLGRADVVILCVPTPLRKVKDPDISYILDISGKLKKFLRKGQLIVLESTTYPGTTRDVILPVLEESGLSGKDDFYLAFSPERIDPGNHTYGLTNIPKLVGGVTEHATHLACRLYSTIIEKVVGLSSPEAAEVTKLLENTFRIVNIGLINEFANLCNRLGIDVWEVIEAAKTKPFGFMPFYPGPGIGGHCVPTDPMYLSWKARKVGFRTRMIDLAAKVNRMMPEHIVERTKGILKKKGLKLSKSRILVLGVTYKKDVNDLRESPAIEIIKKLKKLKVDWKYHDPLIPYLDLHGIRSVSEELTPEILKQCDLVLLVTDHSEIDLEMVADNAKGVFDTRDAFHRMGIEGKNITRL